MDILKRIRTDPAIMAYGLYLYFNSWSYRFASNLYNRLQKELFLCRNNGILDLFRTRNMVLASLMYLVSTGILHYPLTKL